LFYFIIQHVVIKTVAESASGKAIPAVFTGFMQHPSPERRSESACRAVSPGFL